MPKKIAEVEYKVLLTKNFVRRLGCDADHLIHIIRGAVERLTVDQWDKNVEAVRSGKYRQEGLDCSFLPFGLVGKQVYTVEFTPFPRGVVVLTLRNYEDTYPESVNEGEPDADNTDFYKYDGENNLWITSELVNNAPKFTDRQLGVTHAIVGVLDQWPSRQPRHPGDEGRRARNT